MKSFKSFETFETVECFESFETFKSFQRLETFEKLRRIYDAARTLQVSRKDIKEIFESRNRGDIYKMMHNTWFMIYCI